MKTAGPTTPGTNYLQWQHKTKRSTAINDLIKDIKRDPNKGLGKPEPDALEWVKEKS